MWQDWTMMVVGFLFALFLLPAIFHEQKPPKVTCWSTAGGLGILALCMATLGLWLTSSANILSAGAWLILALQRRN